VLSKVDAFHALEIKTTISDVKTKEVLIDGKALVQLLA
jgi:hypothetical protein